MNPTYIGIGIVGVILLYVIGIFNALQGLKMRIKEALSGIDVQLKRSIDLIPNLIETVKGYAKHEREVFEKVTQARANMLKAETLPEKAEANNVMEKALKSIFAVAEAYPDLKASENFKNLQEELTDTENKISYSRQFYNSNVLAYNTSIKTFPGSIFANMFGFKPTEFFAATEEERKKVEVKF